MDEDLAKTIQQFASMLGGEGNPPDNLSPLIDMVSQFASGMQNGNSSNQQQSTGNGINLDDTLGMVFKIKQVMDSANVGNDPRNNLLMALKPYLNTKRQSKVDQCMQFLTLSKILTAMKEPEEGDKQ